MRSGGAISPHFCAGLLFRPSHSPPAPRFFPLPPHPAHAPSSAPRPPPPPLVSSHSPLTLATPRWSRPSPLSFKLVARPWSRHSPLVTNVSLLYDTAPLPSILRCMKRTTACLVVHPRSGKNLARVPDVVSVLAAAGWTTDVVVKESRGETMDLAARAAEAGYDFVIAYGGDGTVNHVLNGVLAFAGKRRAAVGVIPGGTANVWAAEVGIPADPVR